ncbi:hypothetical protein ROZALSC1DRAFT_25262 [Rozella allomycis CSF55]|uniref:Uncharacterized protein n=1 Tax=Rozella allomycis (strain CSF55) TaxID=988480 RepID=A0A4P9YC73_ROZAC|nr:hypothetical protein ROZALSC1DRAFT_25262 [Rozella allomycis CSF55]
MASIFIAFVTFAISYASLKYRGTHKLDRTFQSLVNVTDKQKYFERECLKLPKLQYSEDHHVHLSRVIRIDHSAITLTCSFQNAKEPYILITSNSDDSAPNNFQDLLKSEKLIAWFPQNADMIHEKVYPIPIGLANYIFADRKTLLCINFGYSESSRKNIESKFRGMKNVKFLQSRVDFKEYLEHMMDSKFVLSPRFERVSTDADVFKFKKTISKFDKR